jgi:hypothetical protein
VSEQLFEMANKLARLLNTVKELALLADAKDITLPCLAAALHGLHDEYYTNKPDPDVVE